MSEGRLEEDSLLRKERKDKSTFPETGPIKDADADAYAAGTQPENDPMQDVNTCAAGTQPENDPMQDVNTCAAGAQPETGPTQDVNACAAGAQPETDSMQAADAYAAGAQPETDPMQDVNTCTAGAQPETDPTQDVNACAAGTQPETDSMQTADAYAAGAQPETDPMQAVEIIGENLHSKIDSMQAEEEKNRHLFEEMPVPRALAAMAIPTVISQIIVLIYNLADTFYIGRTNNPYMVAGAALILPIFNVCIAVSNIAGAGGGTLIARLMGAGQPEKARRVAAFSIWFSVFMALFFAVMTCVFMHPLLTFLGASEQTYHFARQYCTCVIVIGAVPTITAMTLANLLRNVGCSKQAGLAISIGGLLNIILDPLFMFVLLPPGYEILGAGLATALSNTITCTNFICMTVRLHNPILHFSLREGLPDMSQLLSFFGVGLPAAMGPFLFDLDYIVLDRLMASHSDIALAAIGIVLKAERMPLNIGIGICLGMVPLAAYNFSAKNIPRMQSVLHATRSSGIAISVACIVLYEVFAPNLVRIFISDPSTVALGTDFLRIRAPATIMMFLSFIYVYFFQALGQGRYATLLVILRWLAINIPMLFILDSLFGMYGCAWAQFVSDTIVALLSWLIYYRYRRAHMAP